MIQACGANRFEIVLYHPGIPMVLEDNQRCLGILQLPKGVFVDYRGVPGILKYARGDPRLVKECETV